MADPVSKIEPLKQILARQPDNLIALFTLGQEYARAEQFQEAVATFQRLLELNPRYSAAYRGLGRALASLGRSHDAEAAFVKGMDVAKHNGDLQTMKEMQVFLKRLQQRGAEVERGLDET